MLEGDLWMDGWAGNTTISPSSRTSLDGGAKLRVENRLASVTNNNIYESSDHQQNCSYSCRCIQGPFMTLLELTGLLHLGGEKKHKNNFRSH